jgi:hypothetical protein
MGAGFSKRHDIKAMAPRRFRHGRLAMQKGAAMLKFDIARLAGLAAATALLTALAPAQAASGPLAPNGKHYLSQPLVTKIYTADPSAHVFNGKIYIYPSHDVPTNIPDDDLGSEYAMHDYIVLSMDKIGGPVTIHPVALDVKDVPWASKQMWAPDAAYNNGTYYLYFPARDNK